MSFGKIATACFQHADALCFFARFRTYFPDAYKKHYPNARTHLSSKIRSTFADGTSLFEKTRSKRRRPFTEAEDRALKAGYEKHGTTWATIVKDPIFQEQNRRSTDLRDRFRNAFPLLYQAAGYKPRTASKKKVEGPVRAADDQLSTTAGPVRSRRRAQSSSQGLLRGGTKSVPQSTAPSEDEESSAEEDVEQTYSFKASVSPAFMDGTNNFRHLKRASVSLPNHNASVTNSAPAPESSTNDNVNSSAEDDDMELVVDTSALDIPDFLPNNTHSDMETWSSSGLNTPTHSSTAAWSTAAASPTSSHVSDFFMSNSSGAQTDASSSSSPFIERRNDILGNNLGMIGKSAWGTQDWFSPNPRLESSRSSTSASSFVDASFSPASPFTYHPHLNHGVLDRYDLFPPSMPDGNSSEVGYGDSHFSDELGSGPPGSNSASSGGTGFKGYHSPFAGDLISGTGARMHQNSFTSAMSLASLPTIYGSSFSSGFGTNSSSMGLGLENIPENASIHPMQLHAHSSSLLSIDELGLTSISLDDRGESTSGTAPPGGLHQNAGDAMDESEAESQNLMAMAYGLSRSPQKQHHKQEDDDLDDINSSFHSDSFGLDDLVDMNELHATPPATPILTQPRPMRRSSGGTMLHNFDNSNISMMGSGHARSISVPPSEARNGSNALGMSMSMDDVGLHMHHHTGIHHDMSVHTTGRNLQALFNANFTASNSSSINLNAHQHQHSSPMGGGSGIHSPMSPLSPILHQQQQQQQQTLQPTTVFPGSLMLSPSSPQALGSPSSADLHHLSYLQMNDTANNSDLWRNVQSNVLGDHSYSAVPYLDLHYHIFGNHHGLALDGTLDDHSEARQGQALDLAQSAVLASSALGMSLSSGSALNLGLPLKGFEPSPSTPVGTIRNQSSIATIRQSLSSSFNPSSSFGRERSAAQSHSFGVDPAALTGNSVPDTSLADIKSPSLSSRTRSNGSSGGGGQQRQAAARGSRERSNEASTIRQNKSLASGGATVSRSMSHHRGQSAVCPQDLVLRNDNKRKRASWDGGLV